MTQEKQKRIVVAITVNLVILIAFLFATLCYQIGMIIYKDNECKRIEEQINKYLKLKEDNEKALEYYKSEEGLLDLAYRYGFTFGK